MRRDGCMVQRLEEWCRGDCSKKCCRKTQMGNDDISGMAFLLLLLLLFQEDNEQYNHSPRRFSVLGPRCERWGVQYNKSDKE